MNYRHLNMFTSHINLSKVRFKSKNKLMTNYRRDLGLCFYLPS